MRKLLTALFGLLVAAAPVAAQDYKPVDINIGFGWTFPLTDFKNSFDAGWNGDFGATFNITIDAAGGKRNTGDVVLGGMQHERRVLPADVRNQVVTTGGPGRP